MRMRLHAALDCTGASGPGSAGRGDDAIHVVEQDDALELRSDVPVGGDDLPQTADAPVGPGRPWASCSPSSVVGGAPHQPVAAIIEADLVAVIEASRHPRAAGRTWWSAP